MKRTVLGALLSTAFAITLTPGQGNAQILSTNPILSGSPTFVSFLGSDASLRSELWYFGNVAQLGNQTPTLANGKFLYANHGTPNSVLTAATPVGPNFNISTLLGGPYAPTTELVFGLFVEDLYVGGGDGWFYTGINGGSNFDGSVHAKVTGGPYYYTVGFEDLCKQSTDCNHPRYNVDWDYNDHMFSVTSTPEPVSMSLIGTGLIGLAGAARRKRKQAVEQA